MDLTRGQFRKAFHLIKQPHNAEAFAYLTPQNQQIFLEEEGVLD